MEGFIITNFVISAINLALLIIGACILDVNKELLKKVLKKLKKKHN